MSLKLNIPETLRGAGPKHTGLTAEQNRFRNRRVLRRPEPKRAFDRRPQKHVYRPKPNRVTTLVRMRAIPQKKCSIKQLN